MKLIKVINAYTAMSILSKEKMPFKDSFNLAIAKSKLKEWYELFSEEERKIVESVSLKDENGKPVRHSDGHFMFKDEKAREEYMRDMAELSEIDVSDKDISPITITAPEKISADLIEALEGFVCFEEESDERTS